MTIHRVFTLLVLLCVLHTTTLAQSDAEKPSGAEAVDVALVTSVSGEVFRHSGNEELPLELGTRLKSGEEVRVEKGAAALVFLEGDYLALEEGERLLLGPSLTESRIGQGSSTRGVDPGESMNVAEDGLDAGADDGLWQSQLASVSSIRAGTAVIAVAPRLAISNPDPVFCWFDTDTTAGGAERSYRLLLYDDDGSVIASQMVRGAAGQLNGAHFEGAKDALRAEPRTHYSWTVVPEGAEMPSGKQDASFVYVDRAGLDAAADTRVRLASMRERGQLDASSMHMLLARYYLDERERLFADAIPHLAALDALPGGGTYAREQLARMFLRFGNQVSTLAPRVLQPSVRLAVR